MKQQISRLSVALSLSVVVLSRNTDAYVVVSPLIRTIQNQQFISDSVKSNLTNKIFQRIGVSVSSASKQQRDDDCHNNNGISRNEERTQVFLTKEARNVMQRVVTMVALSVALVLFFPQHDHSSSTLIQPENALAQNVQLFRPQAANAADYGSLTDEQKAVAEAWRIVDNSFLDRTFNNQDWFQTRQDVVKQRYKNMEEARQAIEKMVSSLGDKYTRYLPPGKYKSIVDSATGNLCGVGIEIGTLKKEEKDILAVIALDVEANSPASLGGIRPGDVFIEVDGTRFDDGTSTPDDVASKLRGPEGSKVGILMERDGGAKTLDVILTREPIKITSVKSYMSDKGGSVGKVGVIRIKSFSGTTAETVKDALMGLKTKGAQAFVLDIRGNPGGLLPGGVDTAALFLDADKPVVFVVNKNGIVDTQSTFQPGIDLESPLVLFTNGNTASAAEVLTAALKENGRAVVAGEQTFGKGIVQTIRQLSNDNGGVAVTVARYETPSHHNINKQGIMVDIPVSDCNNEDAVVCIPASAFTKPKE